MHRPPLLPTIAALVALTLAGLAGCGVSDGDDASRSTTTDASSTSDDDAASTVTQAQLTAILPTLEDLGDPAYTDADLDDPDDPDDDSDDEFEQACPEIGDLEFFGDNGPRGDGVGVTFSTEDDREVEVELDASGSSLTEDNIDHAVEVLNDCGSVTFEGDDGSPVRIEFDAERDDTYGDHGLRLEMHATVNYLGTELDVEFLGRAYQLDGIGVFVDASSGFEGDEGDEDGSSGTTVPLDAEHVDAMSKLMEERVGAL